VYPYLQSYTTSFSYLLQLTENVILKNSIYAIPRNINIFTFFVLTTNIEQTNKICIAICDFSDCALLYVLETKNCKISNTHLISSYLNANSHHKVHGLWTVVYPYLQSYTTSFSYLLQLTENVILKNSI
jgi:hypothetical protein